MINAEINNIDNRIVTTMNDLDKYDNCKEWLVSITDILNRIILLSVDKSELFESKTVMLTNLIKNNNIYINYGRKLVPINTSTILYTFDESHVVIECREEFMNYNVKEFVNGIIDCKEKLDNKNKKTIK